MPAAAVIPALVAYTKFVEVKRLAVECLLKSVDGSRRWASLDALVSFTSFLVLTELFSRLISTLSLDDIRAFSRDISTKLSPLTGVA